MEYDFIFLKYIKFFLFIFVIFLCFTFNVIKSFAQQLAYPDYFEINYTSGSTYSGDLTQRPYNDDRYKLVGSLSNATHSVNTSSVAFSFIGNGTIVNEYIGQFGLEFAYGRTQLNGMFYRAPSQFPMSCTFSYYDLSGNYIGSVSACDIEQAWNNYANNQIDPDDQSVQGVFTWYYNAFVEGYFELSSNYRYVLVINFEERPYPADLGQVTMYFNHYGNRDSNSVSSNSIIDFLRNMPTYIWNAISGGFSLITTSIGNLPNLIWNAISGGFTAVTNAISNIASSVWNVFSNAFTTLFGWLSNILNGILNILSDDTPTNEWLSNFINNFPGINDNIIAQIITLPIHILTKLIGVNTCAPVILGNLYGTNLILPCLGSILSNILGSLINIVGWMVSFYIYYLTAVKIKDLLFEMLTLESNIARNIKIKF